MSIQVITNIKEMREYSNRKRLEGKRIGFVPTMGYLHEGHISLVKKSKELCDVTVVSIFVNPTQFAPNEDLEKYPRDFEKDKSLLTTNNADVIFYPSTQEIYPDGFQSHVEVTGITKKLEGESRPTHFRGVTTVVSILFNIVKPDVAVFGQKDAQQAAVICRMVNDLKLDIEIVTAPIIREPDGLALSSRNIYLSPKEREDALVLSKSLACADEFISKGERKVESILNKMVGLITSVKSSVIDYVKFVETDSFEEITFLEEGKKYYILIACKIGKTRLIDNKIIQL